MYAVQKRLLFASTIIWLVPQASGKFRTGKFRPEVAFTTSTSDRESPKLVLKMALKKWNTNFHLEHFVQKDRTTFSDVRLLLKQSTLTLTGQF